MSVLDQVPSEKKDYQFLSGDISFIDEMDVNKQPMDIDERPELEEHEDIEIPRETVDDEPDLLNASAEETAVFITDIIDTGAAYGIALISKGGAEQYMATKDQKSRIQKIIKVYCDRLGGNIPPWLQLTIMLIIIYGTKIPGALDERKINILQEKIREQEKRLQAYEAERKANELQQQLAQRKREDAANTKKEGE